MENIQQQETAIQKKDETVVQDNLLETLKFKKFRCSDYALKVMKEWKILDNWESPEGMVERLVKSIGMIEKKFWSDDIQIERFKNTVAELIFEKIFVPSTPIMTNFGKATEKPLSACTVPPINLREDMSKIKETVDHLHMQWMGTWFNFDEIENPITMLKYLNTIAIELEESGNQDRPVGNMWIMSVYNKNILDFINIKKDADSQHEKRNFNLSVSIDDEFMNKLEHNENITLTDWTRIKAEELLNKIAESCHICWDPGIIFFERIHKDNPVPTLWQYHSLAPCGEMWLSKGESCQFGYINVSQLLTGIGEHKIIDYDKLGITVETITRFLDDALEYSIEKMEYEENKEIMRKKRKIWIGICWFADMLIKMGVWYWEQEAVKLVEDITSYINFHSKKASIALAKERWSFGAFTESKYNDWTSYIIEKYGDKNSRSISQQDWCELDQEIKRDGLRHCSTTAYPPTWRSSLIFDASPQIEPIFNIFWPDGKIREDLLVQINQIESTEKEKDEVKKNIYERKSLEGIELQSIRDIFKTSTELSVEEHLNMVTGCQKFIDEWVSKTINLPNTITKEEIKGIYRRAYMSGLKWVTIYRNGSKEFQPKSLLEYKNEETSWL